MKYNKLLVAVLMLAASLNAGEKEWKSFKQSGYKPTSYHLKKGIEYLETRLYRTNANNSRIIDRKYDITNKMYHKPLESFDAKTVRWFRKIGPDLKLAKETDIHKISYENGPSWETNNPMYYTIGGAFFINNREKVGRMNTIADLISCLGDIDTEAELLLVLRMRRHTLCKSYRKIQNGYDVKCEEDLSFDTNEQPCGIYAYRIFVSKKGVVKVKTKKRLVRRTECSVL